MKILVTGGAGFIGSHLVDALVSRHEVVVFDNLSTGHEEWVNPRATIVEGSVMDKNDIAKAIMGCKTVFHLAAQTDVRKSIEDPDFDYEINFVGAKNVFDEAKFVGAKVIFTSSAAVYGDARVPVREDDNTRPISQYGWNKLQAERILPENAFIARLFNVYGPRGKSVVNSFAESVSKGKDVVISGTGLQTRDFVYVGDVADALLHGMYGHGIYNIGTGKELTILSALHITESMLGKSAKINYKPGIKGEIARSFADALKMKHDFHWIAATPLRQGVQNIVSSL